MWNNNSVGDDDDGGVGGVVDGGIAVVAVMEGIAEETVANRRDQRQWH